jgi:hypothetical protein
MVTRLPPLLPTRCGSNITLFPVDFQMCLVVHLRITATILTVASTPTNPDFVTISAGSVIETSDDLVEPGLPHVTLGDLLAFTSDIHKRTQHIGNA